MRLLLRKSPKELKMGIKELIFEGKSENNRRIFGSMLKWLDVSARGSINDAPRLLAASGMDIGQTVLEIGCGSGYFTLPAARILGPTGRLVSVDLHPAAVEETQKKVTEAGLDNVVVQREDAIHTTLASGIFDVILVYGVLPAPFISTIEISREMYRLLKPDGIYAIWTMIPLWTPDEALKAAPFKKLKTIDGVFRLQKI
jgi:protein-L-isoaspartate O-methyltransferase